MWRSRHFFWFNLSLPPESFFCFSNLFSAVTAIAAWLIPPRAVSATVRCSWRVKHGKLYRTRSRGRKMRRRRRSWEEESEACYCDLFAENIILSLPQEVLEEIRRLHKRWSEANWRNSQTVNRCCFRKRKRTRNRIIWLFLTDSVVFFIVPHCTGHLDSSLATQTMVSEQPQSIE